MRKENILAGGLGLGILLISHTSGKVLIPPTLIGLIWIVIASVAVWVWRRNTLPASPANPILMPAVLLSGFLLLYLGSSAVHFHWFYFSGWFPNLSAGLPVLWEGGASRTFLFAALLLPLLTLENRRFQAGLAWSLAAVILLTAVGFFWVETQGSPLWRDDHPSFQFRLWSSAQTLPRLYHYNPFWNGGVTDSSALSSGLAPILLLLYPLWAWFPTHQVYTLGITLVFILGVPLLAAGSVRILRGTPQACAAAALMALGVSQYMFLWLLSFGTLGALFASALFMPLTACLYRVVWMKEISFKLGAALILSALACLAWPPAGLMGIPLAIGLLVSLRRADRRIWLFLGGCGVLLLLAYLPTLYAILTQTRAATFTQLPSDTGTWQHEAAIGARRLTSHLRQANPLLVFLGFAGVWVLPLKGAKALFGIPLLLLAALAGWGDLWKPQFEFVRAGIPLAFLCVLPASLWMGHLLEDRSRWTLPLRAFLLALLAAGGLNAARTYGNRGRVQFNTYPDRTREIVEWLKTETPEDGRILFAGRTVHAYGGGHVAFLPVLTGREMMACDYYHFSPKLVEYEYPPRAFRETHADLMHFFDLYNVTHIVTYHRHWMTRIGQHPDDFREAARFGAPGQERLVYEVRRTSSLFLKGSGHIESAVDRLRIEIDDPTREAIISYNWVEGLQTTAPSEIFPVEMAPEVTLIGIRPQGSPEVVIHYAP